MGIYARQDVSFAAHQETEPSFNSNEPLEFDNFAVFAVDAHGNPINRAIFNFDTRINAQAWELARKEFLRTFNELRIPCKLVGRVFD